MFDVCMCMWGKLIPKMVQYEFPITLMSTVVFDLFSIKDNRVLDIIEYLVVI
jgi:hypothetical protein